MSLSQSIRETANAVKVGIDRNEPPSSLSIHQLFELMIFWHKHACRLEEDNAAMKARLERLSRPIVATIDGRLQ